MYSLGLALISGLFLESLVVLGSVVSQGIFISGQTGTQEDQTTHVSVVRPWLVSCLPTRWPKVVMAEFEVQGT